MISVDVIGRLCAVSRHIKINIRALSLLNDVNICIIHHQSFQSAMRMPGPLEELSMTVSIGMTKWVAHIEYVFNKNTPESAYSDGCHHCFSVCDHFRRDLLYDQLLASLKAGIGGNSSRYRLAEMTSVPI